VDVSEARGAENAYGEELAQITNGIVQLFSEYYGRGPTRAKSYLLDDAYVVTVLRDTLTTVERTLADTGHGDKVREVRLTFQEAVADRFTGAVSEILGRKVLTYHSQVTFHPERGFEIFVLEPNEGD
jgi:uncharacterized protein YbcI